MTRLNSLILTLLTCAAASNTLAGATAEAPSQVGDSFLIIGEEFRGMGSVDLIYLGTDGTFFSLSDAAYDGAGAIPKYQPSQQGTYTYAVTPGASNQATLTLNTGTTYPLYFEGPLSGSVLLSGAGTFAFYQASPNSFLANVSNRVTLRPADKAVTGFVIEGTASKLVLLRAVGPTLSKFGVSPISPSPQLNLFSGVGADLIGPAQPWDATTKFDAAAMSWIFSRAGAFALPAGSGEVAYFGLLSPGTYTAQAFDAKVGAGGGSALVEVYILPYSSDPAATALF